MSYYDDASIMFIGGAATGVDGKAGTAKPIGGGSPLFVTRGSNLTATRIDSNGLIEKGRENLLKDSNSFDPSGTAWNITTAFTLTSGQEGYDGSNDAWLLNKPDTLNDYFQQRSINGMSGNVITESIYAKAGTEVGLMLYNPNGWAHWNLSSGTLISVNGNPISSSIESVGNGWYRCSLTVDAGVAYDRMMIKVVNSNAANSSGSIYIQDAQVEQGLVATEYIESGATTGKAGLLENEPRFNYPIGSSVSHLLLEPQRTNVWEYSEYLEHSFASISSITTTQNTTKTLSPEGLYNATKVEGVEFWSLRDFIAGTDTGTWTISCYIKAVNASSNNTFRLSVGGNNYSNNLTATSEWQRFELTITNGGATAAGILRDSSANDANLYIYGMQVEEGSYPTSYIPNHSGGSVSRETELVTTASVPSLINQDEGTFFLDYEYLDGQSQNNQNWFALESENGQERVLFYKGSTTNQRILIQANGTTFFINTMMFALSANTRYKLAVRYNSGDIAVYANGSQISTDATTYTRGTDLSRVTFNESNQNASCRVHEAIVFQSGWDNVDLEILTGATPYQSFESMAAALNYTVYE